jgi:hypothetical protein
LSHRFLAALALVAGLACNSATGRPGLGLSAPSAVAIFNGITSRHPEALHPYVAIANAGKDEIVLVDAVDDEPVLAPVMIRALSIPVPEPRPARLVSGSLGDGQADLLVAVSEGSAVLQVVNTWGTTSGAPDPRIVRELEVDLSGGAGGGVLAIVAVPVAVRDAGGVVAVTSGRVRIVAALTGQRLAVVEYVRAADGSLAPTAEGAVVQELATGLDRFDVVSLAVNPARPGLVYAASPDPIPSSGALVLGAAELDATGAPGAWTWRALSARAPTSAVAAWTLRERKRGGAPEDPEAIRTQRDVEALGDDPTAFEAEAGAVDRVYAVLDPSACGAGFSIDCGIAVLDPAAGGLAADPAGFMPYLAPIQVPAIPLGVVVAPPPALGPTDTTFPTWFVPPFMRIAPGTGQRATSAVAAVLASDGKVYYADLGRWAIPNDRSMLRDSSTRTRVTSVNSFVPVTTHNILGLWDQRSTPGTAKVVTTGSAALPAITVTPGFTRSDAWSVSYQAFLPGLTLRKAVIGAAGGKAWMAMQIATGGAGSPPAQVVRLYSPELGVHRGDIVLIETSRVPSADCPKDDPATAINEAAIEARVGDFIPPDATRPGGAIVLEDPADVAHPAWTACINGGLATLGAATVSGVDAAIRASGFVVTGASAGYAGRTALLDAPSAELDPNAATWDGYRLRYENEDLLACPLVPWPENPGAVACDDACRETCERLVLARKARRIYYNSDLCIGDCSATWPRTSYDFPRANGPVLAFKLALERASPAEPLARELSLTIVTHNGLSPSSRGPALTNAAQIFPTGAVSFDRSGIAGKQNEGYRFYASYASGFVLDFSPSEFAGESVTIR